MQKRKPTGGVLIVVELGAEWPSLAETLRPGAGGRRVLAQEEGEAPLSFSARVGEQLDGLFARGVPVASAVVACNERLDESARSARVELCRSALGAMARQSAGELLLSASDRNTGRLRHALSALATELAGEWQRAAVRVSVCFAEPASPVASLSQQPSTNAPPASARPSAKPGARKVA